MKKFKHQVGLMFIFLCSFNTGYAQERIISAGGSVTEVLYALGLADQIVAVDTSSLYPLSVNEKPKVGYYRQLSPEGVLSLHPTVLVGHGSMGPESVLQQIKATGIEIMHVQESRSVDGIYALIRSLAKRFKRETEGNALIERIRTQLANTPVFTEKHLSALFFLSIGERGMIAAGENTMPDGLMKSVGVKNLMRQTDGFKPLAPEALISLNPDFILVANHALQNENVNQLCEQGAFKLWAQTQGCQVHLVDSLSFMGLSPRVSIAHQHLYEIALEVSKSRSQSQSKTQNSEQSQLQSGSQ